MGIEVAELAGPNIVHQGQPLVYQDLFFKDVVAFVQVFEVIEVTEVIGLDQYQSRTVPKQLIQETMVILTIKCPQGLRLATEGNKDMVVIIQIIDTEDHRV